jgi:very-short-patch-repair endonuclease
VSGLNDTQCRSERTPHPDELIAKLAARHHGVVDLKDLRAAGLSARMVQYRARTGRLHRVFPEVFAVGHPELTRDGWRYAAVRASSAGAVASYLMGAALWGLRRSNRLEVTVPKGGSAPKAVAVHESRVLGPLHIGVVRNIPVTSLARTLVDLAEVLREDRLERVLDHAGRHEAFDRRTLEAVLDSLPGRRGAPKLRALLGTPSPGLTRSELEDAFLALCRRARLPAPRLNAQLPFGDRLVEVDVLFAQHHVIVELDGAATHDTTPAFHADRRRDAIAAAAGFQTLRYTWERVTTDAAAVTAELRVVLARRPPPATR